jgi:hypothetical protein
MPSAIPTAVAVVAEARVVLPVDVSVVEATVLGVVVPNPGGAAKIAASSDPAVAGDT